MLGTLSWLLVAMAALFANVTGSTRVAQVLPAARLTTLVLGAVVAAATMRPQLCG